MKKPRQKPKLVPLMLMRTRGLGGPFPQKHAGSKKLTKSAGNFIGKP